MTVFLSTLVRVNPRSAAPRSGSGTWRLSRTTSLPGLALCSLCVAAPLLGQAPGDTVWVTPEGRYEAGAVHRAVLGAGYRELWETPVPVVVLDLDSFAGGLDPLRLGGGQQTRSLRFQGGDGAVYTFRSVDKDVSRGIDPGLRGTVAESVLQDQISSLLPLSAMVVSPLLDSVGVFNPGPQLVVLPDDPRLGDFREDFAGLLGWIEIRPDEADDEEASFEGAERVVSSPRLFERLEEGSDNRVDARAFLRARLMDFLVGDWDRHPDQWRWAGFAADVAGRDGLLFSPVPRDRDWALARIDGLVGFFAPIPWPQYVGFGPEYPSPFRISWNGRGLDRRILAELSAGEFEAEARRLQDRLTPEVIDAAVATLPGPYEERIGEELRRDLRARRDDLLPFVRDYYELLAEWVDVEATDEDELVRVDHGSDGRVRVAIHDLRDGEPRPQPWFDRTFVPGETKEVRLYLKGGDDTVEVQGEAGPVTVRVVGGGGDDRFVDRSEGRRTRYYDHRGTNVAEGRARIDERDWDEPEDEEAEQHGARPRDWGSRWLPWPGFGYNPDEGFYFDVGASRTGFAFRQHPYANRLSLQLGMSTSPAKARLHAQLDVPLTGTRFRNETEVRYRGANFLNYYGMGNETEADGPPQRYEALRSQFDASSRMVLQLGGGFEAHFGPRYRRSHTREVDGSLLSEERPYGFETFRQFSVVSGLSWNRRRLGDRPHAGISAGVMAEWVPSILDAEESYGIFEGRVAAHLTDREMPLRPTLLLQLTGSHRAGRYPYHDAAWLGGAASLRGYREQRFGGDSALRFNSELRLAITEVVLLFPGELGILGLADVGRVFLDGEESDRWHAGFGGGLWGSWLRDYTLSVSVARGADDTFWYVTVGLPFS